MAILGKDAPENWIFCGRSEELPQCRRVAETITKTAWAKKVLACCDLSTIEVAAPVLQVTVAVGSDNGRMQLAVAIGIPTVTILNGTVGHLYFPWGTPRSTASRRSQWTAGTTVTNASSCARSASNSFRRTRSLKSAGPCLLPLSPGTVRPSTPSPGQPKPTQRRPL